MKRPGRRLFLAVMKIIPFALLVAVLPGWPLAASGPPRYDDCRSSVATKTGLAAEAIASSPEYVGMEQATGAYVYISSYKFRGLDRDIQARFLCIARGGSIERVILMRDLVKPTLK